jgi:hypothetical protein
MAGDRKAAAWLRRWSLRFALATVGLVALVWAAPILAARTPLVSWLCARAAAPYGCTVHVGSASLGWFRPIVLSGVEIRDSKGVSIAQIPRIEGDRSLYALLQNPDDLGAYKLDKPSIDWTFGRNDSNLETLLAHSLQPPPTGDKPAKPALPHLSVQIVDGTLRMHDAESQLTWQVRSLALTANVLNDASETVQVIVAGSLHDGSEAGTLHAELQVQDPTGPNPKVALKGRFTSFPLPLANLLLRRLDPDTKLGGSLQGHCNLTATRKDNRWHTEATGELIANHATLKTPALADVLYVERVRAPLSLRLEGSKLVVQRAEAQSEFGQASVQGSLDFAADWRDALQQPDFDATIEVNLAALADRLPRTLHAHRDVRLTSGQLHAQCKSILRDGAVVWQGHLHTTDLRGFKGAQPIAWTEPIVVDVEARNLHQGVPLIDRLKCSARFLRVEAAQSGDQFTFSADADLKELAEPLGQFVDLDGIQLAGKAAAMFRIGRAEDNQFALIGNVQLADMNLTWFTKQPWQEPLLTATFNASGRTVAPGHYRVETADVAVNAGKDHAAVKLIEPIADLGAGPWGGFTVRLDGDLTRWQNRARCWTSFADDWQLTGLADVQTQLRLTPGECAWQSGTMVAINFRCVGPGVWMQEPTLNVQTAGRWNSTTGTLELTQTKVVCPTVQIDAGAITLQPAVRKFDIAANVSGHLDRLRKWVQDPRLPAPTPIEAALAGRIELHTTADRVNADFDFALKNVTIGKTTDPTWREAELQCIGRGVYDIARDTFALEKTSVQGVSVGVEAAGKIAHCTTTLELDLAGKLSYDLEKMDSQLQPLLGKDVRIVGKEVRPFKVAGPLYPKSPAKVATVTIAAPTPVSFAQLKGGASLNWQSLHAHGCDIGPAEAKAVLQQGWLQLYPIEATLNGGKLRLQPNVRVEADPMELVLLPGPMIEKAKITPALCAGVAGHALPVLANVAEADGTISVTLDGGRLPLSAPTTGELKGTIVIHEAKLGPTPLVRELSALLKLPPEDAVIKDCRVPFEMAKGKVSHNNLELAFADFTIRSSGAVGMDGSLALVVEMPIPARVAALAKLTPTQARQTIRVPIGGTLERPRPDPRALESLTEVLGRSVLENQIERLLQPKR